mmetsp:Transcript_5463/g.6817  ORF Transcript_5463/g.6817 Transcript_5463/m.6817 type:complete len:165 (-) Transcript_5463:164-658(-)
MGNLSKYGINNKIDKLMSSHILTKTPPLMDIGFIDLIKKKEINMINSSKDIIEYTKNGILIKSNDNDKEIECDSIIMATGYNKSGGFYNWLDKDILDQIEYVKQTESKSQYNTKYSSLLGGSGQISRFHNKLAFCGFNDFTGLLQEIRLESEVLAQNIKISLSE